MPWPVPDGVGDGVDCSSSGLGLEEGAVSITGKVAVFSGLYSPCLVISGTGVAVASTDETITGNVDVKVTLGLASSAGNSVAPTVDSTTRVL
jgi:hypothetical protein